jgi:hypothetical protein
MLLLSQISSGIGVAVIVVAALALGLLVAVVAPTSGHAQVRTRTPGAETIRAPKLAPEAAAVAPAPSVASTGSTSSTVSATEFQTRVPAAHEHSGTRVA